MKILGIGGSDHDFSAALAVNGQVKIAISDERINRLKHGRGDLFSLPLQPSIQYCLKDQALELSEVDQIVGNKHLEKRCFDQNLPSIVDPLVQTTF
ncbi:MAG: carbamoyltransferase N-terminal domain-containing protein [bacterium]|nr:carbamoyltransferase N-terminal domain-containing protein [bacterium]